MFVLAGWCEECVARDLLFARSVDTGRIFYVCAACGAAGTEINNCAAHIREVHQVLAPGGWTLALRGEIEANDLGDKIAGDASEEYADLISWYPGFQGTETRKVL